MVAPQRLGGLGDVWLEVGEDHMPAHLGEPAGDGRADAPRRPGHNDDAPVEREGVAGAHTDTRILRCSPDGSSRASKPRSTTSSAPMRPVITFSTGKSPAAIIRAMRGQIWTG